MASDERDRRATPAVPNRSAPVAGATLSRQTPSVGAVCVNCARTDQRGGRPVTGVPTATGTRSAVGGPKWWVERFVVNRVRLRARKRRVL